MVARFKLEDQSSDEGSVDKMSTLKGHERNENRKQSSSGVLLVVDSQNPSVSSEIEIAQIMMPSDPPRANEPIK